MEKSKENSRIRGFLIKKFGRNKNGISAQIKSFKLGYRFSLIGDDDKQVLGNLIEEILKHTHNPKIVNAFLEGKRNAQKERILIEKSLEHETKQREKAKLESEQERSSLKKIIDGLPKHNRNEKDMDIDL